MKTKMRLFTVGAVAAFAVTAYCNANDVRDLTDLELVTLKGATCYGECTSVVSCTKSGNCSGSSNCGSYVGNIWVHSLGKKKCNMQGQGDPENPCVDRNDVCGEGYKVTKCELVQGSCQGTSVASSADDMKKDICN